MVWSIVKHFPIKNLNFNLFSLFNKTRFCGTINVVVFYDLAWGGAQADAGLRVR